MTHLHAKNMRFPDTWCAKKVHPVNHDGGRKENRYDPRRDALAKRFKGLVTAFWRRKRRNFEISFPLTAQGLVALWNYHLNLKKSCKWVTWHVPMMYFTYVPGQGVSQSKAVSVGSPGHSSPPLWGEGLLQLLFRVTRLPPHDFAQGLHSDQSDQWPSKGPTKEGLKSSLFKIVLLFLWFSFLVCKPNTLANSSVEKKKTSEAKISMIAFCEPEVSCYLHKVGYNLSWFLERLLLHRASRHSKGQGYHIFLLVLL